MKLHINIHHGEWALLKKISRSEVKGQAHDQTRPDQLTYNGGGDIAYISTV